MSKKMILKPGNRICNVPNRRNNSSKEANGRSIKGNDQVSDEDSCDVADGYGRVK